MPEGAAEWLHRLPFSIRLPAYGLTVVHAGLVPDVSCHLVTCCFMHRHAVLESAAVSVLVLVCGMSARGILQLCAPVQLVAEEVDEPARCNP